MSAELGLGGTAILSGIFAALVAIAVTRAIERVGGLYGGILATLPTTIIPASIGLSARLDGEKLTSSLFTVPVGMLVSATFLFQWRFWPNRLPSAWPLQKKLTAMICISLGVWLLLASLAVTVELTIFENQTRSIVIFGVVCYLCIFAAGTAACFKPLDTPGGKQQVSWKMLLARGLMAGLATVFTILLSSLSPIASGMASAFPAIFLTVMVGLWVSQGQGVPTGAVGPMMLGGMSPPAYAMIFNALVADIGVFWSCVVSWILAVLFVSVPVAFFLRWRRAVTAAAATSSGSGGNGISSVAATNTDTTIGSRITDDNSKAEGDTVALVGSSSSSTSSNSFNSKIRRGNSGANTGGTAHRDDNDEENRSIAEMEGVHFVLPKAHEKQLEEEDDGEEETDDIGVNLQTKQEKAGTLAISLAKQKKQQHQTKSGGRSSPLAATIVIAPPDGSITPV